MTTLREAAAMALKALEEYPVGIAYWTDYRQPATDALRDALSDTSAQPAQSWSNIYPRVTRWSGADDFPGLIPEVWVQFEAGCREVKFFSRPEALTPPDQKHLYLLRRASESLGAFCKFGGWIQSDADTMDAINSAIAQADAIGASAEHEQQSGLTPLERQALDALRRSRVSMNSVRHWGEWEKEDMETLEAVEAAISMIEAMGTANYGGTSG